MFEVGQKTVRLYVTEVCQSIRELIALVRLKINER